MLIRRSVLGDAENIAVLTIQVWLQTYATVGISSTISSYVLSEFAVDRIRALLGDKSSQIFVAEIDENLVGYAVISTKTSCPEPSNAKVELSTLYIQEPFVGKGIGTLLLKQTESWAKEHKNSSIWLTVNAKNTRAIAFYAKHNYQKLGVTYFTIGQQRHENIVLAGRCT